MSFFEFLAIILEKEVKKMKNENILFVSLISVIVVIAVVIGFFAFQKEEQEISKTDSVKIKEEYALLNDQVNEKNSRKYPTVNLSDENPFVYKTEDEIVQILKGKTALIYFGFSKCPWCRTMLPILESAAKETNLGQIAYLNILDIRDTMELDENNKIIKTKEGTSNYYKILDLLKDNLEDYTLTTKEGKVINTNEKRLFAPTVVAVRDGKVTKVHVGTLDSQKNGYDELTTKQQEELKKIYVDLINSMNEGICNDAC